LAARTRFDKDALRERLHAFLCDAEAIGGLRNANPSAMQRAMRASVGVSCVRSSEKPAGGARASGSRIKATAAAAPSVVDSAPRRPIYALIGVGDS
jgi:hypothetical protein